MAPKAAIELALVTRLNRPDRVLDAVGRRDVEQRRHPRGALDNGVNGGRCLVDQEHRAGLRPQFDHVPRAIVFLVASRSFVLPDDVAVVLVHRKAAGDARLFVRAHPQAVNVQPRCLLEHERGVRLEPREVLHRFRIHGVGVRVRAGGEIDLRRGRRAGNSAGCRWRGPWLPRRRQHRRAQPPRGLPRRESGRSARNGTRTAIE